MRYDLASYWQQGLTDGPPFAHTADREVLLADNGRYANEHSPPDFDAIVKDGVIPADRKVDPLRRPPPHPSSPPQGAERGVGGDDRGSMFPPVGISPSSARFYDDSRLQLCLLPVPYTGNIRNADIVILLLNLGLNFSDYYAEYRMPAFRDRLKRMIAQDFEGIDYPFIWLDPEFCWHSGFRW